MTQRWSDRWRAILARESGFDAAGAARIARGRAWQRSGRVPELRVTPGHLSARVQGSRATPLPVEVTVPLLSDAEWAVVVATLAGQLLHGAQLLAGVPPEGLEHDLEQQGVALFPSAADLDWQCRCDDRVRSCAHLAAAWEAAAVAFEHDPFLLFRLRGRGRERLLADVAEARRAAATTPSQPAGRPRALPLAQLGTGTWTTARARLDDVVVPELPPPPLAAPTLRVLGDPPGWAGAVSAAELFAPLVTRAAAAARGLLDGPEADRADGAAPPEEGEDAPSE